MRDAVALAVAARDEFWSVAGQSPGRLRPLVAASVGPYGAMLADGSEYRGHYALDDAALADFHRPRLQVLATAGADLLACETIPCLREALVLAKLLQEFPGVCAWMSFSCRDGEHTCEGDRHRRLRRGSCAAIRADRRRGGELHSRRNTSPRCCGTCAEPPTSRCVVYPNSGESYDASVQAMGRQISRRCRPSRDRRGFGMPRARV